MQTRIERIAAITSGLIVLTASLHAAAVGTRRFVLREGSDFEGGDLKGVAIDSTGQVRAGLSLGSTEVTEAPTIWSALARPDGSVLLGTGNEGKLLKVTGAKVEVLAETKALVVTSLCEAWGDTVVAATLPDGKVFKWAGGKLEELVSLKDTEHVWAVAFDKKANALYAATGPQGKLWRITQTGQAQVYFDAAEEHLMSVAVAPDGTVYAGSSDKAKLYRIDGPGRGTVLHDFARTEVRAIAVASSGEVYAIANELSNSSIPKRGAGKGSNPAGPNSGSKSQGKGVLARFLTDGTPEILLENDKQHFTSLVLGADGAPYVGTGVEGEVYTVDALHNSALVANTEERQVSALLLGGKDQYVVGSDPAVLHQVRGIGGQDAVWTSKVLDAGIRARFGQLTWDSTGTLELSARSGNTKEPDDSWSDWSAPLSAAGELKAPAARYLQVRARWNRDPAAILREVEIPFVTDNLRAVLKSIEAKSGATADGTKAGVEKSGEPYDGTPDTKVKLSWQVDNPDEDELRYRVEYRMVGTKTWFDMLEPDEKLTKSSYDWETKFLPEGRYRVRVRASDELSNPPDRVQRHELESHVVLVDNSPPSIEGLTVQGRRVQGRVIDGVGPIRRIEIAKAGTDDWVPFNPTDGIFDEQREEFSADVSGLVPSGAALLLVRTYDLAGNHFVTSVLLE